MAIYTEKCKYNFDDIEKIMSFTSWSDEKKIDTLLHIDSGLYMWLGQDSTVSERKAVKSKSRVIYRAIKKLNSAIGTQFLFTMD